MTTPSAIGSRIAISARGYTARAELAIVAALTVFGLALRTANISALPIFNDEAIYLRWAADILDRRTFLSLFIPVAEDGKQPLFVWLSTAAMFVFSDPLVAGRVVSAVAGTASLIGIWLAGRWLAGRPLGLLVATLYAVTPYMVFFDRMALADALVSTTTIWSLTIGVLVATRIRDVRGAVLAGLVLGGTIAAGVWVKPTALFALPIPILCSVLLSDRFRPVRTSIVSLAVAYFVFAAIASLLIVMPYAENQLVLLATHVYSPDQLSSSLPVPVWETSLQQYWSWVQAYLPAPLYWLSLIGSLWALARRPRLAILIIGSWISVIVPSVVMAHFFTSRYVVNSVFPLLFLAALPLEAAWMWARRVLRHSKDVRFGSSIAIGSIVVLVTAVSLPSLLFDARLVMDPASAPWPEADRWQYVEGWPAGYGFDEALSLVLSRARESEGEVFVLSDNIQGFPHDGLALYLRRMPGIRHFVEGEIAWGGNGVLENWRSHRSRMLIVRDDGRYKSEQFETRMPQAKPLGVFWKPGHQSSFRVYELDLRDKD